MLFRSLIGYVPGGAADFTARLLATRLQTPQSLGQPVIVESRAGAGSTLAIRQVATATPDGYTLLLISEGGLVQSARGAKLPYDLERDLAPISFMAVGPQGLVVHPAVPAKNVKDLIALAQKMPGKLSYGSAGNGSAQQAIDWVRSNGSPYERIEDFGNGFGSVHFYGNRFNSYELVGGWAYDSRNRSIFADRGMRHSLQLSYAVPGSTVQYASANYEYLQFVPLWRKFTLAVSTELGYGKALGNTTALPPFKNFFGGGPDSVRGYRESRLGPKDSYGNPYGGNAKLISRVELLMPTPEKFKASVRVSLFYDIGNIFSTEGVKFVGRDGKTPVDYGFAFGKLRQSAGIAEIGRAHV